MKLTLMAEVPGILDARTIARGECKEWTGHTDRKGYGGITVGGQAFRVHRLAWIIVNGPVPDGMLICHRCDNPRCVNLAHLFLGTPLENMRDMIEKGRARSGVRQAERARCPRGHAYNETNTYQDKTGRRHCRPCVRINTAAYRRRKRATA